MQLFPALEQRYSHEHQSAGEAQRLAQEIAFAPIVFQVSRLMVKFGILDLLNDHPDGLTQAEIAEKAKISNYAAQVLLEASLSIGTVLTRDNRYFISKAGWFVLKDKMARVNMDFTQEICYLGMFDLEKTLQTGKPEGLKVFGDWPTIYEGLSSLPSIAQEKWFAFDHYYSDNSFAEALNTVFAKPVKKLLDVGGNTGRWAEQCVNHNAEVEVTIMDLPQQIGLMREATKGKNGADRIHAHPANLLDPEIPFPTGFDANLDEPIPRLFHRGTSHQYSSTRRSVYERKHQPLHHGAFLGQATLRNRRLLPDHDQPVFHCHGQRQQQNLPL